MIKNIVFDMGGVILGIDLQAVYDEFQAIGCPQMNALIDLYVQSGIFLELEEGKIDAETFYSMVRKTMCAHITDRQIYTALCKMITGPEPYKLDLLRELRAKGYNVYLLSNTNPIMFSHFKETYFRSQGLTIDAYFDRLFVSYEMKAVKPHREIFDKLISATGAVPSETLFIDDAEKNIKTGKEVGWHTHLYKYGEDLRTVFENI